MPLMYSSRAERWWHWTTAYSWQAEWDSPGNSPFIISSVEHCPTPTPSVRRPGAVSAWPIAGHALTAPGRRTDGVGVGQCSTEEMMNGEFPGESHSACQLYAVVQCHHRSALDEYMSGIDQCRGARV